MTTKLDGTIMSATVLVPLILALQFGAILVIALLSGNGNHSGDASGEDDYASGGVRYAAPAANGSRQGQEQESDVSTNVAVIAERAATDAEPLTESPVSTGEPVATAVAKPPVQEPASDTEAEPETVSEAATAPEVIVMAEPEADSQSVEAEPAPVSETVPAPAAEDDMSEEPTALAEATDGTASDAAAPTAAADEATVAALNETVENPAEEAASEIDEMTETATEQPDAAPVAGNDAADLADDTQSSAGGSLDLEADSYGLLGPDWLASRNPRNFTIQLQAGANLNGIREFASARKLPAPAAYYQRLRNGQPWYGLVVGDYPDQRAARVAARELENLTNGRPWIRSFGVLQGYLQ